MRDDGDQGAVCVAEPTLTTSAGRTFSAMPRSNSHTSPRLGVIFIGFKAAKDLIGSQGRFLIVQRAGIERRRPAQDLHREKPLFPFRQSFKGFPTTGPSVCSYL